MAEKSEGRNESILTGLSKKRTFRDIKKSVSAPLRNFSKKPKLDETHCTKTVEAKFKYGNYNRYYGYRHESKQEDKRFGVFKKEWFENKSVLDIGCNIGHVSLWIGRHYQPEVVKGVDIDLELIKIAKKNIVHYIDENYVSTLEHSFNNTTPPCDDESTSETVIEQNEEDLSVSDGLVAMEKKEIAAGEKNEVDKKSEVEIGTISSESLLAQNKDQKPQENEQSPSEILLTEKETERNEIVDAKTDVGFGSCQTQNQLMQRLEKNKQARTENVFPYNVSFIVENYVPPGLPVLKYVSQEYHVILCLSVTKWVQLNFGDHGVKMMFQKMYKHLHPGGILILEPQPFKSYKRYKNLTPAIRRNYDAIQFFPDKFNDYLLSKDVGFSSSELIGDNLNEKAGFKRPIYLLTK